MKTKAPLAPPTAIHAKDGSVGDPGEPPTEGEIAAVVATLHLPAAPA